LDAKKRITGLLANIFSVERYSWICDFVLKTGTMTDSASNKCNQPITRKIVLAYLIDTINCDTAGTQKQLIETIRRLDKDRFEPTIICLYSSSWMDNNKLPCAVTTLGYRGFLKFNFLSVILKLRRIIQQRPVHILQTFFEDSIFVAFLATLGLGKQRCILLSSRRDMGLGGHRPWYHRLYPFILLFVNRNFDGIISNGQEIKKWVIKRERVSPKKIHVIPNGTTLPSPINMVPELFKRHSTSLWIGLAASLTPIKRIDVFLDSLRILMGKRPDIEFQALVLGEGPKREELLEQAQEGGVAQRVHFPGAVRDVNPFLYYLDIGVLCSDQEGFPNTVLEYMAHAKPVVVTAVGGSKELVDFNTGFLIPAGDSMALAHALIRLADDASLRRQLGRNGRERVQKLYTWERSMEKLEGYYSQLLETNIGHNRRGN